MARQSSLAALPWFVMAWIAADIGEGLGGRWFWLPWGELSDGLV